MSFAKGDVDIGRRTGVLLYPLRPAGGRRSNGAPAALT